MVGLWLEHSFPSPESPGSITRSGLEAGLRGNQHSEVFHDGVPLRLMLGAAQLSLILEYANLPQAKGLDRVQTRKIEAGPTLI